MFKGKFDRVNAARWLAGALGRGGIVVLAAVVPFALGVMWWFEVPWEEPEGVVSRLQGAVLNEAFTHTDITRLASLEAEERGTASVVVTPLREGTVTEEDLRRIDVDSDLLVPPEEGWGGRSSRKVSDSLIPVPGALVLALSVGSTPSQATELFALVP